MDLADEERAAEQEQRSAQLRAGLFGVHEVICHCLQEIQSFSASSSSSDRCAKFLVYANAVRGLLLLFLKNERTIFSALDKWGGFEPGFRDAIINKGVDEELVASLCKDRFTAEQLTAGELQETFRKIAADVLPSIERTHAFFHTRDLNVMPEELEKEISQAVEKANRSDPNASGTVPLLFYTLSEPHYEIMIRRSIPWPVRVLLMTMFWSKGKDIMEFSPHYRSNWNL